MIIPFYLLSFTLNELKLAETTMNYVVIATINYFTLLLGLTFLGKNKKIHAALMSTAIASDLTLVVILEFKLNVIVETVTLKLSAWNQLHIFCSLAATILYIPIVFLGVRLLRSQQARPRLKLTHRRLGLLVVGFRTIGFFLMFSMLGIHPIR